MTFHKFIQDGPGWETLGMDRRFANSYLEVYIAQVRTPSRPEGTSWTVVHRKGAAVVVPVTADGRFILIKQERVPIRETIWEFPAGQIEESDDHDPEIIRGTAMRELREEAGYELAEGGELISLGHFFPSCGFTDEHSHLFVARHVVPGKHGHSPDEHEAITGCHAFTGEELRAMIAGNEIRDANTLCAYARMCAMGII